MATQFLTNLAARHSYYALTKDLPITIPRLQDILRTSINAVPSAFNSQSNRVILLLGAHHDKFWDFTTSRLRAIVPPEKWEPTSNRMSMFRGGAATILFFEDTSVVKQFQEKFPTYTDKFPAWAAHSDGMLQLAVWTALEAESKDLGANLQHYNPLVDEDVRKEWDVPESWNLQAQMVIGKKEGEVAAKEKRPMEEVYRAYGA